MQNIEKIYEEYSNAVYKYLFCLTGKEDIAEELTQETFVIALKKINKYIPFVFLFYEGTSDIIFAKTMSRVGKENAAAQSLYERKTEMAAFLSEFIVEFVELVILAGVAIGAIFCGKKLRDRKDAKKAGQLQQDTK